MSFSLLPRRYYLAIAHFHLSITFVLALAFLPINRIEAALDRKREEEFDKSSPYFEKMSKFKDEFCGYIEDTWLNGNYNPKIWNQWRKSKNLTITNIIYYKYLNHIKIANF